jgi:hypothetical protein
MKKLFLTAGMILLSIPSTFVALQSQPAALTWTLVGWNDLGMHCMDGDYSVMSILPPFNTIQAHLIDASGDLVTDPTGISVTYEAVADPDGSRNTTSIGKTNFWQYADALFGTGALAPDTGLTGNSMPGAANTPQSLSWEATHDVFLAEGIPITPYDDDMVKNFYPMMRLVARDGGGTVLAETEIVLPVSDEMDCSACHASGSDSAAEPGSGWTWDPDAELDYRLNVLAIHDDRLGEAGYQAALAAAGYRNDGLLATVEVADTPILCARCHASNALPGTGLAGIPPLTQAVHDGHADVTDPITHLSLDSSDNRTACYRCHPGSETRCLRGAMGKAVSSDGALAMQCQSCHGTMSEVGDAQREGWLEEPTCQSCHTGTATSNNGQIRYRSVYTDQDTIREAVDDTFATDANTPLPGFSLYRFSSGHGGLQCSACHGSTHAIFPASHANDNVQNSTLQGHEGTLAECDACHSQTPETVTGGPHGLHPIGQPWIDGHKDAAEHDTTLCQDCHGTDYTGTVLSLSQADWTADLDSLGQREFWRGFRIGCYTCHDGPNDEDPNPNSPATVADDTLEVVSGQPESLTLVASDPDDDPLSLRIVSQPHHGTVGLMGKLATYYPENGFSGVDQFTFAAWDGQIDSNLGTVVVNMATNSMIFEDGFESGDTSAWSAP